MTVEPLEPLLYRPLLEQALREDLGSAGDVTTTAVVPAETRIDARLVAREPGRLAGLGIALDVIRLLDREVIVEPHEDDGADLEAGSVIARIAGSARPILTGERTALNLLSRLSGIATATRQAVDAIGPHPTKVVCTRKTSPGLRALEKYAVRVGGGVNHRFGLYDGVLIKDNHIAAAGGLVPAIKRARSALGHMMKIEVEADSLDQVAQAVETGVDTVLLDNMTPEEVRQAVAIVDGRAVTEVSGGIRPDTLGDYAATGVDAVSIGWLTHSAPILDIGLDMS